MHTFWDRNDVSGIFRNLRQSVWITMYTVHDCLANLYMSLHINTSIMLMLFETFQYKEVCTLADD